MEAIELYVKEFRQKMKTASGSSPTQSIHQLFQDEQSKIVLKHETEAKVLPSLSVKFYHHSIKKLYWGKSAEYF